MFEGNSDSENLQEMYTVVVVAAVVVVVVVGALVLRRHVLF